MGIKDWLGGESFLWPTISLLFFRILLGRAGTSRFLSFSPILLPSLPAYFSDRTLITFHFKVYGDCSLMQLLFFFSCSY